MALKSKNCKGKSSERTKREAEGRKWAGTERKERKDRTKGGSRREKRRSSPLELEQGQERDDAPIIYPLGPAREA